MLIDLILNIGADLLRKFMNSGFINKVKDLFKKAALMMMYAVMERLQSKIKEKILGTAHFYNLENEEWQEKTKCYTVDPEIGEWNEFTVVKNRTIDKIPEEYRNCTGEINDTKEIKREMEMYI